MRLFLFFVCFLYCQGFYAQDIAIGQWKDHLSYQQGLAVAEGNGKVFCLTEGGMISFNASDNALERLSKVNGLSDVEPIAIGFNNNNNKLLIAYKNSNIDIVESNNTIFNVVDVKIKSILGSKTINHVYFIGNLAYLSCAFGIVVIDMDKYEVKDTYIIGPGGSNINVRATTSDASYLYASTDNGVYKASVTSQSLVNYAEWSKMPGLPDGIYNTIHAFRGKVYANFSSYLGNGVADNDTVFVYDTNNWVYFGNGNKTINSINGNGDYLVVAYTDAIAVYDTSGTLFNSISGYFGNAPQVAQATMDDDGYLWIADRKFGLVSYKNGVGYEYRYPDGPASVHVNEIEYMNERLWVAPGSANGSVFSDGIYSYSNFDWTNLAGNYTGNVNLDTLYNINKVLTNTKNPDIAYASSLNGLIEMTSGVPSKLYNTTNSSLQSLPSSISDSIVIGGMDMDASGNLWLSNSGVNASVCLKKEDGTWQSIDFSAFTGAAPNMGKVLVDGSNRKWIIVKSKGILVYTGEGEAATSSNTKLISDSEGNGKLPVVDVYCMALDPDGKVWVGTNTGPVIFYYPENIFAGENYDAEPIYVQQDGFTQILLETELIQDIEFDGAKRVWIATQNSGVFLMSADATEQIVHFTADGSELLSNNVKDVAIDQKSGEVYFATDKGIVSYRNDATESSDKFSNVYAFPNPVKPNYTGSIAIKGLMYNSTVKITDINGHLVYEGQSLGGQAVWDGTNYSGKRVSTGVYMVFCTSEDGGEKLATKILFVN